MHVAAHRSEDLGEINGLVHDAYADADLLTFDESGREVHLPFAQEIDTWRDVPESWPRTRRVRRRWWPLSGLRIPFFQVNLRIRNVVAFRFDAQEAMEDPWLLNEFRFDRRAGELMLDPTTGPKLVVHVAGIELEAEITDHVALTVRRRFILMGESDAPEDSLHLRPLP